MKLEHLAVPEKLCSKTAKLDWHGGMPVIPVPRESETGESRIQSHPQQKQRAPNAQSKQNKILLVYNSKYKANNHMSTLIHICD